MSLNVSPDLLDQAQQGEVTDEQFLACIRKSLPYAWGVVSELAEKAKSSDTGAAVDGTAPPSEQAHGELLRMMASDSMRDVIQRHFGVRIAFQNCCKTGAFTPAAESARSQFVSPRSQLLNQAPELVNC